MWQIQTAGNKSGCARQAVKNEIEVAALLSELCSVKRTRPHYGSGPLPMSNQDHCQLAYNTTTLAADAGHVAVWEDFDNGLLDNEDEQWGVLAAAFPQGFGLPGFSAHDASRCCS
jgi:hypothetical protein